LFGPESLERYIEAAGSARDGAGFLVDLINDLLDLSALQARGRVMKIETLEIPALIDSAVELLQDSASKREIGIHPLPAVELPALAVDLRSTIQCLTNMRGNAIKYSPDGSEIFIDAERSGEFVLIKARDNGIGIPESELSDATEPFHRAENIMITPTQAAGLEAFHYRKPDGTSGRVSLNRVLSRRWGDGDTRFSNISRRE
jgi:signal transduction histidine kinase